MLTTDTIGFSFLALVGFAVGGILYVSGRRSSTEQRKYIYSPAWSPTSRTPKRSFAVLAWAMGLEMAVFALHSYVHPSHSDGTSTSSVKAMPVLDLLDHVLLWVAIVVLIGAAGWFFWTTRSLGQDIHDNTGPPTEGDRDAEE